MDAADTAAERLVVVLMMMMLISWHHRCTAAKTDQDGRLLYHLTEQQPADTPVADVAGDTGLSDGRYVLINNGDPGLTLFRIDAKGLLRTSAVVDRDDLCPQQLVCSIFLDVAVQHLNQVDIIKIHVQLIDLNDNAPAFSAPEVEFHLAESTPPGILFPLPVAADPDGPPNGVVGYRLWSAESTAMFAVRVQNLSSGELDVRLVLNGALDRDRETGYRFTLIAFDGGQPQHSGSTIIHVLVDDVRQYLPRFQNTSYKAVVLENSPPGSSVIQLSASASPGATIVYSFSRRTRAIYGDVFAINSTTGEVTLLSSVDQASYNLSVEASVKGSSSVPGLAALAVLVEFINDRAPVVTIDTLTDSGLAEISVDAPPGTFVAHVSASDPNRGANGHVTCRLDNYGDDFRLVRMFAGEYKLLTRSSFDVGGVVVVVRVLCRDHGDPPLSTTTNLTITITAPPRPYGADNPVFSQTVYNATLSAASRAPAFVIRVLVERSDVTYSFARSYPAFSVDPTSGVIRMVADSSESTTAAEELAVVATAAAGNGSSTATVFVSLMPQERVPVFNRTLSCRVREDAEPGTTVCSLSDIDECLYYDLDVGGFWADPMTGVIYLNSTVDRERTPTHRLTARVQLDVTPAQVVDVLVEVSVEDVNDCVPEFVFPSPENNTVMVVDIGVDQLYSSQRLMSVAVVSARDGDESENGRVSYAIVANNSDSRHFAVEPSTGEVFLDVVDRLADLINSSFAVYIVARDHGRPPLQSVAVLNIILPAEVLPISAEHSEPGSDSRLVVLAGVLSSFVVVVLVVGLAILVVCCKSRNRKRRRRPTNGDLFWSRVQMEPSQTTTEVISRSASVTSYSANNDVDTVAVAPSHLSSLTIDTTTADVNYLQSFEVCSSRSLLLPLRVSSASAVSSDIKAL